MAEKKLVKVMTEYDPNTQQYKIISVDDHCRKPRQRYYETYAACFDAVERINPGYTAEEA